MRKNILAILLLSFGVFASAQTEYDALRLSQTDLNGTARYMSLGGAMGSLGGDASAIKDNPAGLGVYRSSELTGTVNLALNNYAPIDFTGKITKPDLNTKLSFNNFSYITASSTNNSEGLLGSNFSFSYQKLKDYHKVFTINGGATGTSFIDFLLGYSDGKPGDLNYDNIKIPWLTVLAFQGGLIAPIPNTLNFTTFLQTGEKATPTYEFNQNGSLGEYSLGWGGNFNNNFFLGANLNIRSLSYKLSAILSESYENTGSFDLINSLKQEGIGLNAKLGIIYLPTNDLRLGLALHTPSILYITEESYSDLNTKGIDAIDNPAQTPINQQAFNLMSPMQVQASAAYLFGKKGFISAEYNFVNYQGMRMFTNKQSVQKFDDTNAAMSNVINNVHVLKAGAEFRVTPSVALRAGYATMTPAINKNYKDGKILVGNSVNTNTEYFDQKKNINYLTFGVGYRKANWFLDLAYAIRSQKEEFYSYQDLALDPTVINYKTHNIALTLGFRM